MICTNDYASQQVTDEFLWEASSNIPFGHLSSQRIFKLLKGRVPKPL